MEMFEPKIAYNQPKFVLAYMLDSMKNQQLYCA